MVVVAVVVVALVSTFDRNPNELRKRIRAPNVDTFLAEKSKAQHHQTTAQVTTSGCKVKAGQTHDHRKHTLSVGQGLGLWKGIPVHVHALTCDCDAESSFDRLSLNASLT